jgi:hypothetical protein
MVDVTIPVTLGVSNRSIEEVLVLIEKQANVVFKIQDRHIIVKSSPRPAPSPKPAVTTQQPAVTKTSLKLPTLRSSDSPLLSSVSKKIPVRASISNKSILENKLERRINELQELLGPSVPRDIPPIYVNRINFNNRGKGWFASIGTFVNDYSTGVEIQAGMPYLYGIVQPRWSAERGLYGVYGIGNSFKLMRNLSFNTMYTFSGFRKSQSVYPYSSPLVQAGPELQLTQALRQHSVKFAIQYALTSNVTFRFGPVLNYSTTLTDLYPVASNPIYEGTIVYYTPGSQAPTVIYQNGRFNSQTSRSLNSWIGWEGSVSYRINFSGRR